MTKFGRRLLKAIDKARSIARGEADPSTYRVHIPVTTLDPELYKQREIARGLRPSVSVITCSSI